MTAAVPVKKQRGGRNVMRVIAVLAGLAVMFSAGFLAGRIFERLKGLPVYSTASAGENIPQAEIPEDRFLILVNGSSAVPDGYEPELTVLANARTVDADVYPHLQEMFDDMREQGIYPAVTEGYRTREQQQAILDDKIAAYRREGCTETLAEKFAYAAVAVPGTSEHELGLALDINADKEKSSNEEVYGWLAEHAWEYGFIQRYPADKEDITGITYEPWHYRYVGREHAECIWRSEMCLEEYLGKAG